VPKPKTNQTQTQTQTEISRPDSAASLEHDSENEKRISEKYRATIDGLEKERNFYFDKLRDIEILCQTDEEQESELKKDILKILYATDENEEFQSPDTGESTTAPTTSTAGPTSSTSTSDKTLVEENVDDLLADIGENQSTQTGF